MDKNLIINKKRLCLQKLDSENEQLRQELYALENSTFFKFWQFYTNNKKKILKPKSYFTLLITLFTKGPKGIREKILNSQYLQNSILRLNHQYQIWLEANSLTQNDLESQLKSQKKLKYRPKISIILPVYNSNILWLEKCIDSVIAQTYDNWELCIADDKSTEEEVIITLKKYLKKDKRIKAIFKPKNDHISIASNTAAKLATGEYLALLDHDDELTPNALYEVACLLNKYPKADYIYSDEDKIELNENNKYVEPFLKPDWSPELLYSIMYTCHLSIYKKKIFDKVGGFRKGYEGAQDWDLALRVTQITNNIYHIPKVLYHWRKIPGSTSVSQSGAKPYAYIASEKALSDLLKTNKISGRIEQGPFIGSYFLRKNIIKPKLVSIIIPTKDKVDVLKRCLDSIFQKTSYIKYEIIVVDTGSTEPKTKKYYQKIVSNPKVKILYWHKKFNFSEVNNFAVTHSRGDYLLFLNNDIEVINSNWLENMVEHIQSKNVGAVGAKLYFPNKTIQHCGVILGLGPDRVAGHPYYHHTDGLGYFGINQLIRNYSAVTGACLLTKKEIHQKIGGFDKNLAISFNDVDYCLKIRQKGYRIVYTPLSKLYHHESISLGKVELQQRKINENETEYMKKKWGKLLTNDPYFHPNFSLDHEDYWIKLLS